MFLTIFRVQWRSEYLMIQYFNKRGRTSLTKIKNVWYLNVFGIRILYLSDFVIFVQAVNKELCFKINVYLIALCHQNLVAVGAVYELVFVQAGFEKWC